MVHFIKKLFGMAVTDYKALIAAGAVIVDVRTPREFATGNIKGSKNIPLSVLKYKVTELKRPAKPVIAVCASGTRSGIAKVILQDEGLEAYNGGAWQTLQEKI